MKKNNKLYSRAASLFILLTMLLSMTVNIFADTTHTNDDGNEVTAGITSILKAPVNIDVPNATFEYTYTKDGLVNFQKLGIDPLGREVFPDETQPNLSNTNGALAAEFKTNMTSYPNMIDNKKIYKVVGGNIIPDASEFKHAGVYSYTIKQTLNSDAEFVNYMTCSEAEYKLLVYVANGDDGLVVTGTILYKVKDDDGTVIEKPVKSDLDQCTYAPTGNGSDFVFINDYNPGNVGFSIINTVSGKYADMDKAFDFEMKMINKDGDEDIHTFKAIIVDENTKQPVSDEFITFTSGESTSFVLKNNERLVFVKDDYVINTNVAIESLTEGDTVCLPAGMSFELVNKTAQSYICKYAEIMGGINGIATMIGNVGKNVTISDKYLNIGLNQIAIDQSYKTIAVTGVVVQYLPAILLILFATLGIYLKKRSERENEM